MGKPAYVCHSCGVKHLTKEQKQDKNRSITTFHQADCDVCGLNKPVTHIRHYNYLRNVGDSKS